MPERNSFDYALVRVVPRVERGEFVNAGVILFCREQRFLEARIALDTSRLLALAPDAELDLILRSLGEIPRICAGKADAGPIARLSQAERFHWLVSPSSTVIQTSPVHSGLTFFPTRALENLLRRLVQTPVGAPPAREDRG